jgi:hypothetical protein
VNISEITTGSKKKEFGNLLAVVLLLAVVVFMFLLQMSGVLFAILLCLVLGAFFVWIGVAAYPYRSKPKG